LGPESGDLFVKLHDPLAKLRLLSYARLAAQIEELAFAIEYRGNIGIAAAGEKIRRKFDGLGAIALAFQARLACVQLIEALGDDGQIGARHGVVKAHHNVALLDAVAIAYAQLADDAAGRMLDLFYVGIDDDRALGDQRAGDCCRSRPSADAASQHDDDHQPDQHVAVERPASVPLRFRFRGHDFAAPTSGTTLSERDAVAPSRCCSTRDRTSSFGPNAWARP
jgi:hypothetical protein